MIFYYWQKNNYFVIFYVFYSTWQICTVSFCIVSNWPQFHSALLSKCAPIHSAFSGNTRSFILPVQQKCTVSFFPTQQMCTVSFCLFSKCAQFHPAYSANPQPVILMQKHVFWTFSKYIVNKLLGFNFINLIRGYFVTTWQEEKLKKLLRFFFLSVHFYVFSKILVTFDVINQYV